MRACVRGLVSCAVFLMSIAAGHCATYDINIPTNPYDFITFGASGSLQTDASGVVTLSNVQFTMTFVIPDFTGTAGGNLDFSGTINPPFGGNLTASGSIGFLSVVLNLHSSRLVVGHGQPRRLHSYPQLCSCRFHRNGR